jgi:hypothetical protein
MIKKVCEYDPQVTAASNSSEQSPSEQSRNYPTCTELEGLLLCSQEPPSQITLIHNLTSYKINFNIIQPCLKKLNATTAICVYYGTFETYSSNTKGHRFEIVYELYST